MKKTLLILLLIYGVFIVMWLTLRALYWGDPLREDRTLRAELRKQSLLENSFPRQEEHGATFSLDILDPLANTLVVEDITVGGGAVAQSGDRIVVHYRALFEDGEVFDSSRRPGRNPFQFQLGVGQVIRGWDEGIVGMKVGGTRRLVVPPAKAYGSDGFGPIPENATLIYEIELLSVFN